MLRKDMLTKLTTQACVVVQTSHATIEGDAWCILCLRLRPSAYTLSNSLPISISSPTPWPTSDKLRNLPARSALSRRQGPCHTREDGILPVENQEQGRRSWPLFS